MKKIIFLDTETTGNEPVKDYLCQLAFKTDEETFCELFKPPIHIPPEASAVTHITDKHVADKPIFQESSNYGAIKLMLEDPTSVMVAHNARFDQAMYKEIKGDLIELALKGEFDVIAHGCNCFCTMGAGIAVAMKNTFGCDRFELEKEEYKGNIDKLGTIQYRNRIVNTSTGQVSITSFAPIKFPSVYVTIVNAYTQYHYGKNHSDGKKNHFAY
jgi:hypothetical protein